MASVAAASGDTRGVSPSVGCSVGSFVVDAVARRYSIACSRTINIHSMYDIIHATLDVCDVESETRKV